MEIVTVEMSEFMRVVEMAVTAAFYTVAFVGGAFLGFVAVMAFLGEDK